MNPLISGNKIGHFMQMYNRAMSNPTQFLAQLGIPKGITTPEGAVKYLLQSGKVTQERVNEAQVQAKEIDINSLNKY